MNTANQDQKRREYGALVATHPPKFWYWHAPEDSSTTQPAAPTFLPTADDQQFVQQFRPIAC